MDTSDDRLNLLLVDADACRPVLDEGLPGEAAQRGEPPRKSGDINQWGPKAGDSNDLAIQRWAVIAPEGSEGDRLRDAIAPLIRLREGEQGAPARDYRAPAGMDVRSAVRWCNDVYWADDIPEEERPAYVLVLGDLHQISLELQQTLANRAMVGRIHFADASGNGHTASYAAYAEKVVRFARRGTPESSPDLLFFVARDGTSATSIGERMLVEPSLAASRQARDEGKLPAASVRQIAARTVGQLLAGGAGERPSVLLSVSHGLGAPREGWATAEEQWRRQGALVLADDEILDAERMRGRPFLPGGIWFCVACFGAGTPTSSAFHSWLSALAKEGAYRGQIAEVLHSLPSPGRRGFVAAMPQAALANPAGPLAVIAHMDLAWTFGFASATNPSQSRKSRILNPLKALVRGSRAGLALDDLMGTYRDANHELTSLFELEADARAKGRVVPTNPTERGLLWMLRNDLRGYVLLGDPAARLPLRQHALQAEEAAPAVGSDHDVRVSEAEAGEVPLSVKEAAVQALLRGREAPLAIAERAGVPLDVLWGWFNAYWTGRRAKVGG